MNNYSLNGINVPTEEFLRAFFDVEDKVCLRVFSDKADSAFAGQNLEAILDGYSDVADTLRRHNEHNRGIYFVINYGGQSDTEIRRINAQFMEMDNIPFGLDAGTTSSGGVDSANPWRFNSMYWDAHSQLYYTPHRRFNPKIGRWTQPDPHWTIANHKDNNHAILQAGNLFVFAINNPVMFIDPSGLYIVNIDDYVRARGATVRDFSSIGGGRTVTYGSIGHYFTARTIYMDDLLINEIFGWSCLLTDSMRQNPNDFGIIIVDGVARIRHPSQGIIHTPVKDSIMFGLWVAGGYGVVRSAMWLWNLQPSAPKPVPFNPSGPSIQDNVDPRTLIPTRSLEDLQAHNVREAGLRMLKDPAYRINVNRSGTIIDGHHRTQFGLQRNIGVRVRIQPPAPIPR